MTAFVLHQLIPGMIRLMAFITIGVFAGCLLEYSSLGRKLAVLSRPFERWSGLPPICASAFAMAFVSPRAANGMLAGAFVDRRITRKQMISGALTNAFPNTFLHLRSTGLVAIPLLGITGLLYVGFQLLNGLLCTAAVVIFMRLTEPRSGQSSSGLNEALAARGEQGFKTLLMKAWQRTCVILKRVLMLTLPIYLLIGLMDHYGLFTKAAALMPGKLASVLSPASITVIAAQLSGVLNAASAASKLLESGTLTHMDVFIALLFGYAISVPVRMIRHTVPATLGVFPGRDGLQIVFISQGLRLAIALLTILCLLHGRLS